MGTRNFVCGVCEGRKVSAELAAREMMFGLRDPFLYLRCGDCGCLQLWDVPKELGRYYPSNYYSYRDVPDGTLSFKMRWKQRLLYPSMVRRKAGWPTMAGSILCSLGSGPYVPEYLQFLIKPVPFDGGVLDIGCGAGTALIHLRDCGFRKLRGADPFINTDISYPGDVQIHKKSINEMDGRFSLVMLHHVFEHVPSPIAVLAEASRLVLSEGQILIRIPLSDSEAAETYKENWIQLDAPRHLFLHTRTSMAIAAERAGLIIRRVVYDSTEFQFWGSEQYARGIPLEPVQPASARGFDEMRLREFRKRALELNRAERGDQAAFVLQRLS